MELGFEFKIVVEVYVLGYDIYYCFFGGGGMF